MKMMKNLLSCFVAAAMLAAAVPAVAFAADNAALEQAIVSVKNKIQIPDEYTEFESSIYSENSESRYELTWTTKPSDYEDMKRISITANAHGDVISYYTNNRVNSDEIQFAKYTGAEMKDMAAAWLSSVNPGWMSQLPDDASQYPETGSVYSQMDSVSFRRMVNGLPFCGDSVRITVNNRTGEIVSMYADWTYLDTIPAADSAVSVKDAGAQFLQKSPMTLTYQQAGDSDNAVLVYTPKNTGLKLNGRTGEEFVPYVYRGVSGGGGSAAPMANESADMEAGKNAALSESEIANIQEVAGLLSEAELRARAEGLKGTGIEDARFMSCTYQNLVDWKDDAKTSEYRANLSYMTFDESTEKEEMHFSVTMDAVTGELLSYSSYPSNYDQKEAELSAKDALSKAEFFASGNAAEQFAKTKAEEQEEETPQKSDYYFTFVRHENDVPFDRNFISVSVDKNTGRICSFHKSWSKDMTFESPDGILSAERAGELLMEKAGMSLSYALAQNGEKAAVELMYQLNPETPYYIGAKTGDLLNYDGGAYDPAESKTVFPEDLDGHYAQTQVYALIESGVLTLDENETAFRPDEAINQKDLLAFVSGLKMGHIPYRAETDSLLSTARRYGIITESIDPDAIASREDGVVFIIRALGYDKVASLTGIFQTNFEDEDQITEGRNGYVALARGFGIIGGDENNCFQPQDNLTRGDAAIMIYNYMAK